MEWGILVQRAMNARFIIVGGILVQDPAQVRLPEKEKRALLELARTWSQAALESDSTVMVNVSPPEHWAN